MSHSSEAVVIVEITGMPGAGKSTFLDSQLRSSATAGPGRVAFRGTWSHGRTLLESLRSELSLWGALILRRPITSRQAKWLWRRSCAVDAGFGRRINILRNCLLKFAYPLAIRRTQRRGGRVVVYVDEGISHIPFLLQESGVECRTIEAFVDEFAVQLRELHVLFLDAPAELVRERLRRRGHARIPRGDEACLARFVETSARTAECLKRRRDAFAVFDIACSR